MANSGGGMIVYGVKENQKVATGRADTGEFSEGHERAYRSVAVTAIVPPVFGIEIHRLGINTRAVAVSVPASVDGPHLNYKNDYFGAPLRNDADTAWMKERQLEAMYRAQINERLRATAARNGLYRASVGGHGHHEREMIVAAPHT